MTEWTCYHRKRGVILNTRLKTTRQQKGLTQVEVAKKANITVTSYQRYETGERIPRADTAKLIAKALNSTVEELF
jgi:hypothetical protein